MSEMLDGSEQMAAARVASYARAAQMQGMANNVYCAPVERDAAFIARMMGDIGQAQTTLREKDYLRLCQMAAKGL